MWMNDITSARLQRRHLEDLRWVLTREYWKQRAAAGRVEVESEELVCLPTRSYSRKFLMSLGEAQRQRLFQIEEALARLDRDPRTACVGVGIGVGAPVRENSFETTPLTDRCSSCERRR